jgi:hypothetical protein
MLGQIKKGETMTRKGATGEGSRTSYHHTLQVGIGPNGLIEFETTNKEKTSPWANLPALIDAASMDDGLVLISDGEGNDAMVRPSEIAWITHYSEKVKFTRKRRPLDMDNEAPF